MSEFATQVTYPLSSMQKGILFHTVSARNTGHYVLQLVCCLREDLNVFAFIKAWNKVVARHDVLRTSFKWLRLDEPIQSVHSNVEVPIQLYEWSDMSEGERQERLQHYLLEDRRRGFELDETPIIRLALFRATDAEYQFVWTSHHSMIDGRSVRLLIKEVFTFYEAFRKGEDLPVEATRPFASYIDWLRLLDLSDAEKYWRENLKGFVAPTKLAGRHSRKRADRPDTYRSLELKLPQLTTSKLKRLSANGDLTLNTFMQGAWALLLSRYSGDSDVVFGATRDCRHSAMANDDPKIGMYINTLPFRVQIKPEMDVFAWLEKLHEHQIELREFKHTPLAEIQGWSDVPKGTQLFETVLVVENYHLNNDLRSEGGAWSNREFQLLSQTNYPITLYCYGGTEVTIKITYDLQRFEEAAIRRIAGHLRAMLGSLAEGEGKQVGQLSLLTEAEAHQIIMEWNDTATSYIDDTCIHELFERQVELEPDRAAVEFDGAQLTYSALNGRANQLAHHLRKLGVGPESLIGICTRRSIEMVIGLLAILKAGGAYIPLDPAYPRRRLEFMLEDTNVPILLTESSLVDSLPDNNAKLFCLDKDWQCVSELPETNPEMHSSPSNLAYVIYTSGSTGRPKGVAIEHKSAMLLINWARDFYGRDSLEVTVASTSICFDLAVYEIFATLGCGGNILLAGDALEIPRIDAAQNATLINTVPSAIAELTRAGSVPASVQTLNLAGEPLSQELVAKIYEQGTIKRIFDLYGPSEDTTYSTCSFRSNDGRENIGRPLPNKQVYLLADGMQPVPVGVAGGLFISGAGVARCYLNEASATAEKFLPHQFGKHHGARLYGTGDLARFLPDGRLEFLGRIDHQVKVRGYRIELGEIETALRQHPQVREAVVAAQGGDGNKTLMAYITIHNGQSPGAEEIRQHLKEMLPGYMIPTAFIVLESLPLTPNGKIDRKALAAYKPAQGAESDYVAPRTSIEQEVARIWAEVLGLEKVGIHSNFFEMGGHSLMSMRVVSRLRSSLQVELQPINIFKAPTVATLAILVAQTQAESLEEAELMRMLQDLEGVSDDEAERLLEDEILEEDDLRKPSI
ncbi:MAG: amino acid adenylation domain-containing protein [Blastocatellia bacterium]